MLSYGKPNDKLFLSSSILHFIESLEAYNINMHSFAIIKDNTIITEGYWKPFKKGMKHRMFSITKSYCAIAIGFLIEENKLKISDKVCDLIPEKAINPDKFIKEMNLHDMLIMSTTRNKTTFSVSGYNDHIESFINYKSDYNSNSFFSYDTSASHTLAYIVEKFAGMPLLDYLEYKMDIKFKNSYILSDEYGMAQGGSGLVSTMDDIMKVGYFLINKGNINGKSYFKTNYLYDATTKQISTDTNTAFDEQWGYGYQIWKTREDGFMLYGLGSQLVICVPKHNIIFCSTADTRNSKDGTDTIIRLFWDIIYKDYIYNLNNKLFDDNSILENKLNNLEIYTPQIDNTDYIKILNKTFNTNKTKIKNITFNVFDDYVEILLPFLNKQKFSFIFGINKYIVSDIFLEGLINPNVFSYGYAQVAKPDYFLFIYKIAGDTCAQISIQVKISNKDFTIKIDSYGLKDMNIDYDYINGLYTGKIY